MQQPGIIAEMQRFRRSRHAQRAESGIHRFGSVILMCLNQPWDAGGWSRVPGAPFRIQHHAKTEVQVMPRKPIVKLLLALSGGIAALMPGLTIPAQGLEPSVQVEVRINRDSERSQQRVSSLAQQTQDLLYEYRAVVRETEALKIYNDNLERVVVDQRGEIQSINQQLEGLEETNRGVVPLMLEMIDVLDRIVEADIPFRIEERRARVERLRDMMDQAEVTASEKYRRVMEAYQGELEFGRTTEAYSEKLPTTGQTVDFLRVGRTLLVYQSSDGAVTGWFNPGSRAFEELPDRYRLEVQDGLAIARNEKAPDLVMLPVPGPEAVQ